MRLVFFSVVFLLFPKCASGFVEPLSLFAGVGAAISLLASIPFTLFGYLGREDIGAKITDLRTNLNERVHGQHLAVSAIPNVLSGHWTSQPSKPLVMLFEGFTGTGKSFTTTIIEDTVYKDNKCFFKMELDETKKWTKASTTKFLLDTAYRCPRALYVFEECGHIPWGVVTAVRAVLEYQKSYQNVDFRKTTFIFISNNAGGEINKIVNDHLQSRKDRRTLTFSHFEKYISGSVHNTRGGIGRSGVVSRSLIDLYVPFLPLEMVHVAKCVESYLKRNKPNVPNRQEIAKKVIQEIPKIYNDRFSASGCKRIDTLTSLFVS